MMWRAGRLADHTSQLRRRDRTSYHPALLREIRRFISRNISSGYSMFFKTFFKTKRREKFFKEGLRLLECERWNPAALAFRRAAEVDPTHAWSHSNLAIALLKAEQWQEAVPALEQAIALNPELAESHINLGIAWLKLGAWEKATAAYRRAIELNPDAQDAHKNLGMALLAGERWGEAAETFSRALEFSADVLECQFNLGNALLKLGRWGEAVAAYRRAVELDPTRSEIYRNLGTALMRANEINEAAEAYRQARSLDPDNEDIRRLEAALSRAQRPSIKSPRLPAQLVETNAKPIASAPDLDAAEDLLQRYRQAVDANPDDPDSHIRLGAALFSTERWAAAQDAFQRAVDINPNSVAFNMALGAAQVQCQHWEAATSAFQRCIALDPKNSEAHINLGATLFQLKRLDEALVVFQRALVLAPDNPQAHVGLENVRDSLSRHDEARSALDKGATLAENSDLSPSIQNTITPEQLKRATAEKLERILESFWAPENLPADTFRVERWFARLTAQSTQKSEHSSPRSIGTKQQTDPTRPAHTARLLFVLDNDYGELTTIMYFVLGQSWSQHTTLLLPEHLYAKNAGALPGRALKYVCLEDIKRAVDEVRPDIVFLCSAYLFSIHKLLTLQELDLLVDFLRERGCRIVTADPFLGMLSMQDPETLINIDIPQEPSASGFNAEQIESLRNMKATEDERLRTHLARSEEILADTYHLYPAYTDVSEAAPVATDSRNISFFNPRLIYPETASTSGFQEDFSAFEDVAKPHWLFVISTTDYETQTLHETHERFIAIVSDRLKDALDAGRHPILIGPNVLIEDLIHRIPDGPGVDILSFCSFNQFVALSLTAEHAFYWNVVSHSILVRLFNGLPVTLFDRGHLVRNVMPMYERVVNWYYQGFEPAYIDHRQTLSLDTLAVTAERYREEADRLVSRFRRAPSPAEAVERILSGGPNLTK